MRLHEVVQMETQRRYWEILWPRAWPLGNTKASHGGGDWCLYGLERYAIGYEIRTWCAPEHLSFALASRAMDTSKLTRAFLRNPLPCFDTHSNPLLECCHPFDNRGNGRQDDKCAESTPRAAPVPHSHGFPLSNASLSGPETTAPIV